MVSACADALDFNIWGSSPSDLQSWASVCLCCLATPLCCPLGIAHHQTTAYHPESNGMIERFHRNKKNSLRAPCVDGSWSQQLPWVFLGLLTTPQGGNWSLLRGDGFWDRSTEFSPSSARHSVCLLRHHRLRHHLLRHHLFMLLFLLQGRISASGPTPTCLFAICHVLPLSPPYTGPVLVLQRY